MKNEFFKKESLNLFSVKTFGEKLSVELKTLYLYFSEFPLGEVANPTP